MTRRNFPITIDTLKMLCEKEQAKGNGKKFIFVSNDEEGNGFHECYFGFSKSEDCMSQMETDINLKDIVVLG